MENKANENNWIPVSSAKYPEVEENVYVTVDNGEEAECIIAYMGSNGVWYGDKNGYQIGYVTAWKPIQDIKPYKAEEKTVAEREKEGESDWIPVTKELPEDLVTVQVTYVSGVHGKPFCDGFAYIEDGTWYWVEDDGECNVEITAWKPMCKPYTPQKGEK